MGKIKVYLAGGISDTDRKAGQRITAQKIRDLGFDVYSASENDSINDKSNNPTPLDIYNGDIERIKECDIFVVRISGGHEDGTISEIGMVAGWNEQVENIGYLYNELVNQGITYRGRWKEPIKIIAYTTNERMTQPQFWNGIASGGFNHLVAGMIDKWGAWAGTEQNMLDKLEEIILDK